MSRIWTKTVSSKNKILFNEIGTTLNYSTYLLFSEEERKDFKIESKYLFSVLPISSKATKYKDYIYRLKVELENNYSYMLYQTDPPIKKRKIVEYNVITDTLIDKNINFYEFGVLCDEEKTDHLKSLLLTIMELNDKRTTIPKTIITRLKLIAI